MSNLEKRKLLDEIIFGCLVEYIADYKQALKIAKALIKEGFC
jgi:hypothetical protein